MIALLSGNRVTRPEYTAQSIQMALLSLNPQHYSCSLAVPKGVNDLLGPGQKLALAQPLPAVVAAGGPFGAHTGAVWAAESFDHVAIGVESLAVSRSWYKAVLQMEDFMQHEPTFVGEDLAFLRQGGAYLALLALPRGQKPLEGSRAQRGHFAMRVDSSSECEQTVRWRFHCTAAELRPLQPSGRCMARCRGCWSGTGWGQSSRFRSCAMSEFPQDSFF